MAQDVAFVARFYSPPGSGRTSSYALYVCDLDGSRRRRVISRVPEEAQVAWIDDRTLALSSEDGQSILVVDRRGKTLRKLSTQGIGSPDFASLDEGPLYVGTDTFRRRVMRSGFGPRERTPTRGEFTYGRYVWEGKPLAPPRSEYGELYAARARPDGNRHLLIAGWVGASAGETLWLWSMPGGRKLSTGLTSPQFDPRRRLYWGLTPGRSLSPYGKTGKRVWTSKGFVAPFGQTDPKPIIGGYVFVSSISIRPK